MREVSVNGPLRSHAKGAFCAGADLKERAKMTPDEVRCGFYLSIEGMLVLKWGFRCLEVCVCWGGAISSYRGELDSGLWYRLDPLLRGAGRLSEPGRSFQCL